MKLIFILTTLILTIQVMSQDPQPTEDKALMWVTVTNFDKKPLVGEQVEVVAITTKETQKAITNNEGKCWFLLNEGETYDVKYKEISELTDYSKVEVPKEEGLFEFQAIIMYDPPKVYTLRNVHFDTGKATLKPVSFEALNELVDFLKRKSTVEIEIAGHTDDVGDDDSNLKLSQQRAESVKNYLVSKGIAASRLTPKGYGETRFISKNDTEEGKAMNRRTEVKILKE